jgi:hypothetical protein
MEAPGVNNSFSKILTDWFVSRTQEFIELECEELATIDALREKADKEDSALPSSPFLSNGNDHHELSKSLFNVRHREPGANVIKLFMPVTYGFS